MPFGVARATRLITTMTRCVSDVSTYNQLAVDDPRSSNMFSLDRQLQRDGGRFGGAWHGFEQGRWAGLRGGALEAYKTISISNPKAHALVDLLDQISRRPHVPQVVVRTSNRTAAMATIDTLSREAGDILNRMNVAVLSWSERLPWNDEDSIEILPAAPPVVLHPILWSAEASEHIILAYKHELPLINSQWRTGVRDVNASLSAAFGVLGLGVAPHWDPKITLPSEHIDTGQSPVQIAGADLEQMLERMRALEEVEQGADDLATSRPSSTAMDSVHATKLLVPIKLEDGRVWWVDPERSVDVLIANRYCQRLVEALIPGDRVVIPRGDGRESVFARLVAAHHRDADVVDLDFLLLRFRKACLRLYRDAGDNWAEVARQLESNGASAVHQAKAWAEGSTLAPAEPSDVRLVAELAGDTNLSEGWSRIAATAELLRTDHQQLGRLVSGALGELASGTEGQNIRNLTARLGQGAAEILDEFLVATVRTIGAPATVAASLTGTVQ